MAEILQKPVLKKVVIRTAYTDSQAKRNRVERWQNMEGRFGVVRPDALAGKHVLLADDAITTGAAPEAFGRELLAVPNVQLSVATLCFSSH